MVKGDRVEIIEHSFLSDGFILKDWGVGMFTIKLDEKAPNEYAWETDEVLMFDYNLKVIKEDK